MSHPNEKGRPWVMGGGRPGEVRGRGLLGGRKLKLANKVSDYGIAIIGKENAIYEVISRSPFRFCVTAQVIHYLFVEPQVVRFLLRHGQIVAGSIFLVKRITHSVSPCRFNVNTLDYIVKAY